MVVLPNGREAPSATDEVTVLVTGFGPFLSEHPRNPSWLIASTLPQILNPTSSNPIRINIRVYPEAIRVAYQPVLELLPRLLSSTAEQAPPDIVLHMGLAARRTFFTLERGAHRTGYSKKADVIGEVFEDEESLSRWPNLPEILQTGFDVEDVYSRWESTQWTNSDLKPDVRISEDAGNYLCGFTYYRSLAWFYNRSLYRNGTVRGVEGHSKNVQTELPVAFLHVPPLETEEEVDMGRNVTIALIRAIVASEHMRRTTGHLERMSQSLPRVNERVQAEDAN